MSHVSDDTALVVLVDGTRSAGSYLEGETCLHQVSELASMMSRDIRIVLSFGHSSLKWTGRGTRTKETP